MSNVLIGKIGNWKVQQEVNLNTDHNLISFEFGQREAEKPWERLDFKHADWSVCKNLCSDAVDEWLEGRSDSQDLNEEHSSFEAMLHQIADKSIPKKKVCRHSKGWWSPKLTQLSKDYKRAETFSKRSDEVNERRMKKCLEAFKREETEARNTYLDNLAGMLDPKTSDQFWRVINSERKQKGKNVVQPIKRDDNSLAVTDEEIFYEMRKFYGKETLEMKEIGPEWYDSWRRKWIIGWMDELRFYVPSTVFQSFRDDGRMNMKGSVQ